MPTIRVNDIDMYYEIHGEGRPVILIGGLAIDVSELGGIISWLAQRYRVLAFDNRGAGRTDKPDIPYSIEMMAEDTEELMKALAIEQATILGISMGGRIALALALQHPERVERLVLVSTSARVRNTIRRMWRLRLLSLLGSAPIFRGKYSQPRYAFLRQLEASGNFNCTDRLHELHVPAVIMHGKKDKSAPYTLAEEMHADMRGSQMIMFQGGHIFFLVSEHQQFFDAVVEFLGS